MARWKRAGFGSLYQTAHQRLWLEHPSRSGETNSALSDRHQREIFRMVVDTAEIMVGDMLFAPVPFLKVSNISSGEGQSADTGTITMDGREMLSPPSVSTETVLQNLMSYPLRDRPLQIGLLVLDLETKTAIGLIPQFVGIIDRAVLERNKGEASVLTVSIASYRAYAQRRVQRLYSHTDHQTRYPGDGFLKHLSDTVFRAGKYAWNSQQATGSGAGRGGGGNPYRPGRPTFNLY